MAGIRSDAIVRATGSPRVVRAMPNTPALIGQGIAGLFARPEVDAPLRAAVEALLAPTGRHAVGATARPTSTPSPRCRAPARPTSSFRRGDDARPRVEMGLSAEQGQRARAGHLRRRHRAGRAEPDEPPEVLRERVTSKGGTTYAALESMREAGVREAIVRAGAEAAQQRAAELGDEFGRERSARAQRCSAWRGAVRTMRQAAVGMHTLHQRAVTSWQSGAYSAACRATSAAHP